ncbi:MAG TPA: hypothetical protein VIN05_07785 [Roseovarius sp.]
MQKLRERLAEARSLKRMVHDAPDRLRRDAAIIDYTRALDLLVEDLIALEDAGVLAACADRLNADTAERDDPPV